MGQPSQPSSGAADYVPKRAGTSWMIAIVLLIVGLLAGSGIGYLAAPRPAAQETLAVIGPWAGAEMQAFLPILDKFQKNTGITVSYSNVRQEDQRRQCADRQRRWCWLATLRCHGALHRDVWRRRDAPRPHEQDDSVGCHGIRNGQGYPGHSSRSPAGRRTVLGTPRRRFHRAHTVVERSIRTVFHGELDRELDQGASAESGS